MSRRYWGFVFALGVLIAGQALAQEQHPQRVPSQPPGIEKQGASTESGGANPSGPSPFPVTIVETPDEAAHASEREQNSDKHDAQDLRAQQKAADAADVSATAADRQVIPTYWQAFLATIGAAALIYSLALNRQAVADATRSADAAIKAADAAENAYVAEQRPWLFVSNPRITFSEVEAGAHVFVEVDVKNVGKTPALSVAVQCKLSRRKMPLMGNKAVKAFAAECTKPVTWTWGETGIFPDRCEAVEWIAMDETEGPDTLHVIICVTYRSVASKNIFHTAFAVAMPRDIVTILRGSDSIS